jgi:hypothetical protein
MLYRLSHSGSSQDLLEPSFDPLPVYVDFDDAEDLGVEVPVEAHRLLLLDGRATVQMSTGDTPE